MFRLPAATTIRLKRERMRNRNINHVAGLKAPFEVGSAEQPIQRRCLSERLSIKIG